MRKHVLATTVVAMFLTIPATALAARPTVTTGAATAVTQTTAKLNGTIKPNNEPTTWHFEIGGTTAYGTATGEQGPIQAGSGNTRVSFDAGALQPGTTYHYRLVGTNASGSVAGRDRTFTTRPALTLNASRTPVIFGSPVTLSGQVFGAAPGGVTVTLQENPYPFADYKAVATAKTDANGNFAFIRTPIANTAYRVVAETTPRGTSTAAFVLLQDKVSLKVSTSRPSRGRSVLFTGFSAPPRVGAPVYIQRLGSGGWRTVLRAKLAETTQPLSASFAVRLRRVRSGVYRAYVPIGFDHVAGASKARRITVRR